MKNKIIQQFFFSLITISALITALFLLIIIFFIFKNGFNAISWEFITSVPKNGMTAGGVSPAIIGSFCLVAAAILFSLPLGLACAVYLQEYSPKNYIVDIVKTGVSNLASVPSVVFGLFGLAVFVKFFGFGVSILSGGLTLAILVLPNIITTSQEALSAVPYSFREASLALGATQWQTIRKVVLPAALPGILTGIILSIGRAAGETAPIMFTAAVFYKKGRPDSIMSEVMALPYHIYALMTEGVNPEKQTVIAYGCALILLVLVAVLSSLAVFIRNKYRSSYER
ncbi:MAG: phosphate ABC transporter permease PstA [Elusimicrobiota bacterium]|jgi:phosphate transport system permease protein|nr:phosphate ABC transporter permease PstA [Elusimicrobiota bacterium]